MMSPLDGIRVLELTRVSPGALCTRLLSDFGAEVLKIQSPEEALKGDDVDQEERRRAAFRHLDRNKKSLVLDLKQRDGQRILHGLAEGADVLVEGFRPGVTTRLRCDWRTLRDLNPRLVYCSLSGYGQDGSYRDLPGHDINYLAMAGVLGLIGEPGRPPVIPLNLVADYGGAAMHALAGILLALFARERTDRGQLVDISYLDATLSLLAATPYARDFFLTRRNADRGEGPIGGSYAYYTTYETADGKRLAVGCAEPWLWRNFCRAIGREGLERAGSRIEHLGAAADAEAERARAEVQEILRSKSRDEWFRILRHENVCVAPVYEVEEAFADPNVRSRGMVVEVEDPEGRRVPQVGVPVRLSETPGRARTTGPLPGQHTDEVLAALGYSERERARLHERGVVRSSAKEAA